jgi:branched-chain amino acid transport system permease protein
MELGPQFVLHLLNGLVWGLILALMALGLNLIYGVLRIINVAHGALYMLGAVLGWSLTQIGNFWLALALAPILVGLLGLLIERTVLRPVEARPVMTIIATFGLLLLIQHAVLFIFGGAPRPLPEPLHLNVSIMGFHYPGYRLFVASAALLALGGLWLLLHRTRLGLWLRAVAQSRELALSLGIPVPSVYLAVVGLGAALAALAGVLTAPIVSVSYQMGDEVLVAAFIVVVVGGLGSLEGSIIAALSLGLLEGLLALAASPLIAKVLALVAMGSILIIRPQGLFGREG